MKNLIFTFLLVIIASVAFSQKKTKCTLDLRDDYAFVEDDEPIDIRVFDNDIGNFVLADAKILELAGCGPHHGEAADPDTDCFTYRMNHFGCGGETAPSPTHPFNYLDTFEYYVGLVCDDYCNPGDGKIWRIEAEYIGPDGASVEVYTKKDIIHVGSASELNTGDYFTIDGTNIPGGGTVPSNTTDWDYTFTFQDKPTQTVRVHTSCSQLIFGVNFENLLIPRTGCIATFKEMEEGACNTAPLQRKEIKTRSDYIFPKTFYDTAMVIIETAVLPIHILDFSLTTNRNENHVSWSINNVINEQYIALEKSYDGNDFFELKRFEELYDGDYSYIDQLYDRSVEMHYYRLAIADFNGSVTHSNVIIGRQRVDYGSPVLVYPNPSSGIVTVELLDDGIKLRSLSLDDISGKRIMYVPLNLNESISLSLKDQTNLDGIYIMSVELNNGEVVYKKILLTQ